MQKPALKNVWKKRFTPWGVAIFIILSASIFIPAIGEYRSSRAELLKIWREQGQLLSEIILRSGHNIMAVEQEMFASQKDRLLDIGRFVRQIDSLYFPQRRPVMQTAHIHAQSFPLFFDASGNPDLNMLQSCPALLQPVRNKIAEELHNWTPLATVSIITNLENAPPGPPIMIIRRVNNRGFIALLPRPGPMREEMERNRLHAWLEQVSQTHSVLYIELSRAGKLIDYSGVHSRDDLPAPPAQTSAEDGWRLLQTSFTPIFEYTHRIPEGLAVRVGLSATALNTLNTNLKRRLFINSLILLVVGSALTAYILKKQNYALLSGKYQQIQTMTGSILEQMSDGIIVLNSRSEIVIYNKAAEEFLAPDLSVVQDALLPVDLLPFPEDVREAITTLNPITQSLQSGSSHIIISANRLFYRPEPDISAEEMLYLILLHDYTSQKELDDFRSRKNRLLAMGQLAARVAHEIRNPLNGIGVIAQRLQREYNQQAANDEYRQLTQAIRQETGRINTIVENFLIYARSPELKTESLNLSELVDEMKPILASLGAADLTYQIDENCIILADRDQMSQVVLNLVKNALEAVTDQPKIHISLQNFPDKIQLGVADNGPGVDPEIRDKIFDLYFTTKENGSGIGLSVVEKIVTAHGGQIRVESPYELAGENRSGAHFFVELDKFPG
jgi:signal transduction histidine kinase